MATESSDFKPLTGHCTCKTIQYTLLAPPLVTHCCHCTWCQRETGSAFVLNALIETSNFKLLSSTQPMIVNTPSASGKGQLLARCPNCFVAVYSHYAGAGKVLSFVRVGTLEEGSRQRVKPDVHIYTNTKMEWVDLSAVGVPVCEEYYEREDVWSKESLKRRSVYLEKLEAEKRKEGDGKEAES
ncbi:glutathione-dependent formaldehyde-activating, GFA [Zopfia rhizophila CBS 207.26]|uniref:Glutathione-dependent formaldehyde-activating, GFA n=1 Tax=Zopfia rhizophila CBS 207.26 TaxID=1314779 RepID=A0A6A6EMS9_9PEZI|nr:glutathione-dependent formaldehyde-activating, GFA [Zopfia rhizophila CBS 207.26]